MMIHLRLTAALVSSLAVVLLQGCSGKQVNAAATPPPPEVLVATVIQKDVPIYGKWVATLDGYVNANIQPQVTGYLIQQNYREGSFVHKGDVLFEIDPRPFQALLDQARAQVAQARGQLAQAQAQFDLSTINVNRDTPLAAARAIAQSQLDNDIQTRAQNQAQIKTAEANIQTYEAAVEQAQLNLGFTHVVSLIDGIAGIATTQIGNLVGPATVLTSISQVDPIKAYFPITEQEYLSLAERIGKGGNPDFLRSGSAVPLELTLSNQTVFPHQGRIVFADRNVNNQTGTIRIVGAFANPGNILRPGQFGRIRALTTIRESALLVPEKAVSELQGSYQVAIVEGGNRVALRSVTVGDRVGRMWIVNTGLQPGERIVSEGTSRVRAGIVVNPRPDPDTGDK